MQRPVGLLLAIALAACTTTTSDTTPPTAPATTGRSTTTTTAPERCPDVFCLVYTVAPGSSWSDGTTVTSKDFIHTLELLTDTDGPESGNPGYELVTGFEAIDDDTFMVVMSEVFAPWRTLFEMVFPAHAPYDPVLPGPTSGPFSIAARPDETTLHLQRNSHYSGPDGSGTVQDLRFVVAEGVREAVSGLIRGDYHVINPAPQDWMVGDLASAGGVTHTITPGAYWEHITFHHDDPMLSRSFVREAIVAALDREGILDVTARTIDPDATALGNTMWMSGSGNYQDNFHPPHDVVRARSILEDNGCEEGGDGVFVCDGARLSFVWATTTGDALRTSQLNRASAALADAGIEVSIWTLAPSVVFSTPIFFGTPASGR